MKIRNILLVLAVFAGVVAAEQQVYSGLSIDEEIRELQIDVDVVEQMRDASSVDFAIPGLGTVRLTAAVLEDGSSHFQGDFPVAGEAVALGLLQIDSGVFQLLPDGALSYTGKGTIAGHEVSLGLTRLLFLTEEDKAREGKKDSGPSPLMAIKEAVFSLRSEIGFFTINVGENVLFQVQEAQLIFEYQKTPHIKFFIDIGGQRVEAKIAVRLNDPMVEVALTGEEFDPFLLVPQGRELLQGLPVNTLRFSGKVELSTADGISVEGRLFDAKGTVGWNISPFPEQPVVLEALRLSIDTKLRPAIEATGSALGSKVVFKGALEDELGLVLDAEVAVERLETHVPWMSSEVVGALGFAGNLRWSAGQGFELMGALSSSTKTLSLWGVALREAAVDVNLTQRRADISGLFSVFDLDARAFFSLEFGSEVLLTCSAELVNQDLEEWSPPSLAEFVGNGSVLAPFIFRKLGILVGLEASKRPVRALKKVLNSANQDKKTTIPLSSSKKISLFFAVEGEAVIMGQLCRSVAMVQQASKFGFLILAEPVGSFSLARAFPEVFAYRPDEDTILTQYLKNVIGGAALSDVSLVLSSLKDIEEGVEPGVNITGAATYAADPRENPLFKPFFSKDSAFLAFKKDGDKGIGLSVAALVDPINFKNSVFKSTVSSGDYGLFLNLPNVEEVGLKQLALHADFYPFAAEVAVVGSCLYVAEKAAQPMKIALEASANLVDVGGSISAAGDFDVAAFLPLVMGRSIRDTLSQRIILRDGAFEFKTTWVAIASLLEAVGSAIPTLGVGTVLGGIAFLVSSISSLGLSGEVEIGQLDDPLRGRFVFKGGVDVSELIFEILGEKPGGFNSLVCFLFDMLLYIVTFGKKDLILPDMRDLQAKIAQLVPLDIEKFYLKFVPLGTRIGEAVVPFGMGGSLHLKLFDKFLGADLMLDSQGAYLLAYVDPIDLWGLYRLSPSKTIGQAAQAIEEKYQAWGLNLLTSQKERSKKIAIEASAHLEKSFTIGTDFDVRVADSIGGSVRARLGLSGLDLQGDFSVKIPELAQLFGVQDGELKLWLKGTQVDLDNPLLLLQQLHPKNIGLEIGFEDTLKNAFVGTINGILKGVEERLNLAINTLIAGALTHTKKQQLFQAEELVKAYCEEAARDGRFAARCLDAQKNLAVLQARDFILDRLDDVGLAVVPEALKLALETLKAIGAGTLHGGRWTLASLQSIFSIEQIVWRGTLQDLSQGRIPGFDVKVRVLGTELVLKKVGMFDFTKSPREWLERFAMDVAQIVVQKIMEPFGELIPPIAFSGEAV